MINRSEFYEWLFGTFEKRAPGLGLRELQSQRTIHPTVPALRIVKMYYLSKCILKANNLHMNQKRSILQLLVVVNRAAVLNRKRNSSLTSLSSSNQYFVAFPPLPFQSVGPGTYSIVCVREKRSQLIFQYTRQNYNSVSLQ